MALENVRLEPSACDVARECEGREQRVALRVGLAAERLRLGDEVCRARPATIHGLRELVADDLRVLRKHPRCPPSPHRPTARAWTKPSRTDDLVNGVYAVSFARHRLFERLRGHSRAPKSTLGSPPSRVPMLQVSQLLSVPVRLLLTLAGTMSRRAEPTGRPRTAASGTRLTA